MSDPMIRPADRTDLPRLLDLYVHLNPDDARCSPENAVAVFEHLTRYEGNVVLVGTSKEVVVTAATAASQSQNVFPFWFIGSCSGR